MMNLESIAITRSIEYERVSHEGEREKWNDRIRLL